MLYACETWTVYQRHIRKLNRFHLTCLRKLLHIGWRDMIPDTEVLRRTGLPSIDTMLTEAQLRWSGHIVRMGEERLPKRLLYGELQDGKRSVGGQRKRYKDTLKVGLNKFQIDPDTWEDTAANRSEWRSRVAEGAVDYEEDCLTRAENKRRICKTFSVSSSSTQSHICTICGKSFRAAIGLFSHKRTHCGSADFTTNTWSLRGMRAIILLDGRTNDVFAHNLAKL